MPILTLVPQDHAILRQVMEKFDFKNPPVDPIQLAKDLAETMVSKQGLGLSANQVNLPYRVFVITGDPIMACFNPIIVNTVEDEVYMDEGCLSYPFYYVKVKRPRTIRLRFTMPNGETTTRDFTGMTARVIQHELDHLDGIVFKERANAYHRDVANKNHRRAVRNAKKSKKAGS